MSITARPGFGEGEVDHPPDVSPAYWRHVHNRLAANQEPRLYTRIQHKAWLLRAKALP